MGAWGYGYRDNDNYYNEVGGFVDTVIEALAEYVETCYGPQDFRARLMWTVNTLQATDEDVPLSESSMEILRLSIEQVREDIALFEDEEFLKMVEKELQPVEKWLDGFKEMGMLEDRMGAIVEAIAEKDSNGTET